MEYLQEALPEIIAFIIIAILTFIGWGIRKIWTFTHQVQLLFEKEMTNGKPAHKTESTKDLLTSIRDLVIEHHKWAIKDAEEAKEKLEEIKAGVSDE